MSRSGGAWDGRCSLWGRWAREVGVTARLTRRPGGAARLRALLNSGEMIVAPGAFDPLAATLVEEAGFAAVYMTGLAVDSVPL